jgi:hypothetical protein
MPSSFQVSGSTPPSWSSAIARWMRPGRSSDAKSERCACEAVGGTISSNMKRVLRSASHAESSRRRERCTALSSAEPSTL